jgi:anti-anti-sigma factor
MMATDCEVLTAEVPEVKPVAAKQRVVWRLSGAVLPDRNQPGRTAESLHEEALTFTNPGDRGTLIVDLSEVVSIDGRGLQILVALAADALQKGRNFEITSASSGVASVLELAGIGYLMSVEKKDGWTSN